MTHVSTVPDNGTPTHDFYREALQQLDDAGVPFLVGGAFAFYHLTGIERSTKDIDIFMRPIDVERALRVCERAGYRTELTFPHWLGKVISGDDLLDIIFSSANGVAEVDDAWFEHASWADLFGTPVRVAPPEEIIWSKGFILERERYDGHDIAHLILAQGEHLDWERLLARFGEYWRVLFVHLVLFGFIYPDRRSIIPRWVMDNLLARLQAELTSPDAPERVCRGTLLSWSQYLVDVRDWGYEDARLWPIGHLSEGTVAHWTTALKG